MESQKVMVRVPATTANLGSGFDCLGMALGLYNTLTIRITGGGLDVRVKGEGAEALRWGEENRVLRALRVAFEEVGKRLPGMSLELDNNIPLARGLGSSAAATVGGLIAGNALCDNALSTEQLLQLALRLEGHPDNVAAALLGGLVIVVQDEGRLVYGKIPVPDDLQAALFVPSFPMSTAEARRILPARISRGDAVYNLGRVALLTTAIAESRYDLLDVATRDRLHQPYREAIFPGMPHLFEAARQAGALGVFLSGSGSTILALCTANAPAVADALAARARELELNGRAFVVPVTSQGADISHSRAPRPTRARR